MRVISGKFRSRRLKGLGTLPIRPTSDRLRETLFNVLGASLEGAFFVDMYAGTGAVGIEAISRGARDVVFIESSTKAARLIRKNLESLGIVLGAELIEADAARGLELMSGRHLLADFIFLDPPYQRGDELAEILELLDESHLLAPYGIIIAEHSHRAELPVRFTRLERSRVLEQGEAALSFYRLAAAA